MIDFLAIGDIVTDAFIRINEGRVREQDGSPELCLRFGDKLPYESLTIVPAVGNSGNAATTAARLGLKVALISNVGHDQQGKQSLATLKKNKVKTNLITVHKKIPSNYHFVLWHGDDRTILIKHEKYPYRLPKFKTPRWIYLSSLGEDSLNFHREIANYLKANPQVKLAFQPGTYQIKMGANKLASLYGRAEVLLCNRDEAQRILKRKNKNIKNLLSSLRALGPRIAIITDGKNGAYAQDSDGQNYFMPTFPDPKPPLERTGAGDSFSATIISALIMGQPLTEALRFGPINSMSVIQKIGAQAGLLDLPTLKKLLATAPTDYQIKKIA
ncbi:MAG: carbohydrate kinase family protein [Candidatus Paceibacterota bacterium]|jgi:ribokinase